MINRRKRLVICIEGRIRLDDKLLMVSFGAGLTWGALVLQMAPSAK